jgi:hypothetical protein
VTTSYDLPMPNDKWLTHATPDGGTTESIVVASVWGNDTEDDGPVFGVLMILLPISPFYAIVQCEWNGDGWWENAVVGSVFNINEATALYADNGGDI